MRKKLNFTLETISAKLYIKAEFLEKMVSNLLRRAILKVTRLSSLNTSNLKNMMSLVSQALNFNLYLPLK